MDKSEALNRRQGNQNNTSNNRGPTANGNPLEKKSFRSLICDESGIIIGEMVYRCLICSFISESMDKVRAHYQTEHVDIEDISNGEFRYVNNDYFPNPPTADSCNDEQTKASTTTPTSTASATSTSPSSTTTTKPKSQTEDQKPTG